MPCEFELDLERRWVRARAWGLITFDEGMATRLKFLNDPNFSPDFCQIYDAREVTRIALTASQDGELARASMFSARSRRAFVAPRSDTYGLARMYQTYRQINAGEEQIRIFRSMDAAEAWLSGLSDSSLAI